MRIPIVRIASCREKRCNRKLNHWKCFFRHPTARCDMCCSQQQHRIHDHRPSTPGAAAAAAVYRNVKLKQQVAPSRPPHTCDQSASDPAGICTSELVAPRSPGSLISHQSLPKEIPNWRKSALVGWQLTQSAWSCWQRRSAGPDSVEGAAAAARSPITTRHRGPISLSCMVLLLTTTP